MYGVVPRWRSEDSLWGAVLSFYHMDPKDQPQVLGLCGRCLYPLNNPTSPMAHYLTNLSVMSAFLGFMEEVCW